MRIISGQFRGKNLIAPIGNDTRPTSDKARQGIFNILEHAPWSEGLVGKNVLDVFAGTGAFGLESLSRGAQIAWFIENDKSAIQALNANISACRVKDKSKIIAQDALKIGKNNGASFDIVFMDPPYDKGLSEALVPELQKNAWLSDGAILVLENHKSSAVPIFDGLEMVRQVNYGINGFAIYKA